MAERKKETTTALKTAKREKKTADTNKKGCSKPVRDPELRPHSMTEMRNLAQHYSPEALHHIVALTECEYPSVALAAAREILDRGYGRPMQPRELTGKAGGAIKVTDTSALEKLDALLAAMSAHLDSSVS